MKTELQIKVFKQFFTPRWISDFAVEMLLSIAPEIAAKPLLIVDPSCGEGAFLLSAKEKLPRAAGFTGIDKDPELALIWNNNPEIKKSRFRMKTGDGLLLLEDEKFDLALGNPPFGLIDLTMIDEQFKSKSNILKLVLRGKKVRSFPVEILFFERFLDLLADGGLGAVVMPLGFFTNDSLAEVRGWISDNCQVMGIVSFESKVFAKEGTGAKTGIVFFKKTAPGAHGKVFYASAINIEPHRGTDHLSRIVDAYRTGHPVSTDGIFFDELSGLRQDRWDPGYHHPRFREPERILSSGSFPFVPLSRIMDDSRIITAYKGPQEIYDREGSVPLITSRQILPTGIYYEGCPRISAQSPANVKRTRLCPGDVLLVRSGEGCVGRAVLAGVNDIGSNIRSEIYILRPDPLIIIPEYLVIFLNSFLLYFHNNRESGHRAHYQICRLARGVGTPNLNKNRILRLKIPLIPYGLQKIFADHFKTVQTLHQISADKCSSGRCNIPEAFEKASSAYRLLIRAMEEYVTGGDAPGRDLLDPLMV